MSDENKHFGARFVIDASRGSVTVRAFADGIFSFAGHHPTFAAQRFGGEIQLAANNAEVASLLIVVNAESLYLIDKRSEKDREEIESALHEKILSTADFSEIYFVSRNVSMRQRNDGKFIVEANGAFSIRGRNLSQTIVAEAEINAEGIRANGEISLRQSDFGIEPYKTLGGTLKVKDEVKISFDIAARI